MQAPAMMNALWVAWLAALTLVVRGDQQPSTQTDSKSTESPNLSGNRTDSASFTGFTNPYKVEIEDLALDGSAPVLEHSMPSDTLIDSQMSNIYSEMMGSTDTRNDVKQHHGGFGGHGGHGGHGGGIKKKKKRKPKPKKKKKAMSKFLHLLLIPFMIQTSLIPVFIMKLKMIAMKAAVLGKLALILLFFNFIRNYRYGGAQTADQYYDNHLAEEHYGYNGGQEVGAWVNGRSLLH